MEFRIDMEDIHAGWFDGSVFCEGKSVEFSVSYFGCHALKLLCDGVIHLIENFGNEVEVSNIDTGEEYLEKDNKYEVFWSSEPEGYKWILAIDDEKNLNIRFLYYARGFNEETIENEKTLNFNIKLKDFLISIIGLFEDIISRYGFVNYRKEMMDFDLPVSDYFILKAVIDEDYIEQMGPLSDFEELISKAGSDRLKQIDLLKKLMD